MAHPRGGDFRARARPHRLHLESRSAPPPPHDLGLCAPAFSNFLRTAHRNSRLRRRLRGNRSGPARAAESRRRGALPRALLCLLLAHHRDGARCAESHNHPRRGCIRPPRRGFGKTHHAPHKSAHAEFPHKSHRSHDGSRGIGKNRRRLRPPQPRGFDR